MEALGDINIQLAKFTEGTIMLILNDGIHINQFPFSHIDNDIKNKLIECRIFDKEKEILIKKTSKGLVWRERNDSVEYIENTALLRGEIVKQVTWLNGESIAIKKHDYIGYNSEGLASYIDSRFVEFVKSSSDEK